MLKRSYIVVLAMVVLGLGLIVSGCTDTTSEQNSTATKESVVTQSVDENTAPVDTAPGNENTTVDDSVDDSANDSILQYTEEDVNKSDNVVYVGNSTENEQLYDENDSQEYNLSTGNQTDEDEQTNESEDNESEDINLVY